MSLRFAPWCLKRCSYRCERVIGVRIKELGSVIAAISQVRWRKGGKAVECGIVVFVDGSGGVRLNGQLIIHYSSTLRRHDESAEPQRLGSAAG